MPRRADNTTAVAHGQVAESTPQAGLSSLAGSMTRTSAATTFLAAIALGLATATPAVAVERCNLVLSYFRNTARGCEWRTLERGSRSNTDTLFMTLRQPPGSVSWDTSFAHVTYLIGDTLYRADWRLGSQPKAVMRLPRVPSICSWWFNPDSARWQLLTKREQLSFVMPGSTGWACRSELWQSSRDGMKWHRVLVDTTVLDMEDCGLSIERAPMVRSEVTVSPDELVSELTGYSSHSESMAVDSTDEANEIERYYVPSASVAQRGVEFRFSPNAVEDTGTRAPCTLLIGPTVRANCCAQPVPQRATEATRLGSLKRVES
jgi:hypothetical protein